MSGIIGTGVFSFDIWHVVISYLDDKKDLCRLSLVSKALRACAIPRLYHHVILEPRVDPRTSDGSKPWKRACGWIQQLVDDLKSDLVPAIRIVEVARCHTKGPASEIEEALPLLVKALPNLSELWLHGSESFREGVVKALHEHPNLPQLHLLDWDGQRLVTGPLPRVTQLEAYVNAERNSGQDLVRLQELFFSCPNLKHFSLRLAEWFASCVVHERRYGTQFVLTGRETFPVLETLAFRNYKLGPRQWPHWRDKFDWSGLRSLSLGPNDSRDILEQVTGRATALTALSFRRYVDGDRDIDGRQASNPRLNALISSIESLERLVVKGHFVPISVLGKHRKLKDLCLHSFEMPGDNGSLPRLTLDAADLMELNALCPDMESLEIDIARRVQWPRTIIKALATGFDKLRHLTLHCESGLTYQRRVPSTTLPVLTEALVKRFASQFFKLRPSGGSRLQEIVMKTGEELRGYYGQYCPQYVKAERRSARMCWVRAPRGGEVVVRVESVYEEEDDDDL